MFSDLGLLDGRLLAAHSVHVSAEDIAILADGHVGVAHCPCSNAKLASGIMPLAAMRAAGVRVGLGTDGPASNDTLDLLGEARLAALLTRLGTMRADACTATAALRLATAGGAAALGRDDIGVLEEGRWADVVHLDAANSAFVAGLDAPDEQIVANLLWAAGSHSVTDVWVAGTAVVAGGRSTRVDEDEVRAEVVAIAARLRSA